MEGDQGGTPSATEGAAEGDQGGDGPVGKGAAAGKGAVEGGQGGDGGAPSAADKGAVEGGQGGDGPAGKGTTEGDQGGDGSVGKGTTAHKGAAEGDQGGDGPAAGGHGAAVGGLGMDGSATGSAWKNWQEGMDPNSSYLLKIRLFGNPKKARKEIKCFCFDKIIDSDLTNYKDLVESIVEQYAPRYLEVAHVQYYGDVLKILPEVKSDQELMSMFEKHAKTKVVQMFIQYCDPSEPYEPIMEYCSDVDIPADNNTKESEDSYLRNPIPENEHVGIDEEKMYLDKEPIPLNVVLFSEKEKDKSYVLEDDSEEDSEDELEVHLSLSEQLQEEIS